MWLPTNIEHSCYCKTWQLNLPCWIPILLSDLAIWQRQTAIYLSSLTLSRSLFNRVYPSYCHTWLPVMVGHLSHCCPWLPAKIAHLSRDLMQVICSHLNWQVHTGITCKLSTQSVTRWSVTAVSHTSVFISTDSHVNNVPLQSSTCSMR